EGALDRAPEERPGRFCLTVAEAVGGRRERQRATIEHAIEGARHAHGARPLDHVVIERRQRARLVEDDEVPVAKAIVDDATLGARGTGMPGGGLPEFSATHPFLGGGGWTRWAREEKRPGRGLVVRLIGFHAVISAVSSVARENLAEGVGRPPVLERERVGRDQRGPGAGIRADDRAALHLCPQRMALAGVHPQVALVELSRGSRGRTGGGCG